MMPLALTDPAALVVIKSSVVLIAACGLLPLLRTSPAATRHLVCAWALAGAIVIPFVSLVPAAYIAPFIIRVASGPRLVSSLPSPAPLFGFRGVALSLWIAGSIVLLLRVAVGYALLGRVRKRSSRFNGGRLFPELNNVVIADVSSPLSFGLIRPAILLPQEARSWAETSCRAVLLHELAHIRRGDLWWNLVASLATALHWYNPLVWRLARRMRHEAELACDDTVVRHGVPASSYAAFLLDSAAASPNSILAGCAMNGGGRALRSRLKHVLDQTVPRQLSRRSAIRTSAALCALVLAAGIVRPAAADQVEKVGGDVTAPKLIHKVEPWYSEAARNAKVEGTVRLSIVVGTDGKTSGVQILQSLHPDLDRNATEAVSQWLFEPGTKKGKPVPVRATIEINFRLN
jgi:TonB family protein